MNNKKIKITVLMEDRASGRISGGSGADRSQVLIGVTSIMFSGSLAD